MSSSLSSSCFDVEVTDKVAHIRLNRPDDLNSMVREFWTELPEIVRGLDARGDVGRSLCPPLVVISVRAWILVSLPLAIRR